ncbi:hypothetical protein ABMA27_003485 [Loxostege sticticalis]|uniref:Uncharacterized protein n=1 Tax=Loxostege sticticalis TaxID=481309 RepID=A0ABR3HT79_LOXSC
MSDSATEIFHEYANKEETPVVLSKGLSSSSVITPVTTSMSFTSPDCSYNGNSCRCQRFTDPTRTRCRFELREGEHHIVKKSRALGTRIGFGSGPDPNTYWNF